MGIFGVSLFASELVADTQATSKKMTIDNEKLIVPSFVEKSDLVDSNEVYQTKENIPFDLTKNATQTQVIEDEDGNLGTLTVDPETPKNVRGKYSLSKGYSYWRIYIYTAGINMSYRIKVYRPSSGSASIKAYYDESYTTVGWMASGESFYKSRNAVYYKLKAYWPGVMSKTYTLKSSTSGSYLYTTFY